MRIVGVCLLFCLVVLFDGLLWFFGFGFLRAWCFFLLSTQFYGPSQLAWAAERAEALDALHAYYASLCWEEEP